MSISDWQREQIHREWWSKQSFWKKVWYRFLQALFIIAAIAFIVGLYLLDKFRWGL